MHFRQKLMFMAFGCALTLAGYLLATLVSENLDILIVIIVAILFLILWEIITDKNAKIKHLRGTIERREREIENQRKTIAEQLKKIKTAETIQITEAESFPSSAPERIRELTAMDYRNEYLKTPEWRTRSNSMKARFNNRCQVCNNKKNSRGYKKKELRNLVAHHRTYRNCGNEKPIDLTVLCTECHDLIHDYYDGTKGFGE